MSVLVIGYFGQRNMGDELTNIAAFDLITANWGLTKIDLLNMGTQSVDDIKDFCQLTGAFLNNVQRVWFDIVRLKKYEAVLVINSGWIHSFCMDVVMHLLDLNTPVFILCAKNITDIVKDGMCHKTIKEIAKKSKLTGCRFKSEADLINGQHIMDPAELLQAPLHGRVENSCKIYCPRWFEEENARNKSSLLIDQAIEQDALILACNPHDAKLCEDKENIKLVRGWQEPLNALKMIYNASSIISGGRLHPVLLGASFGIPSALFNIDHDAHNKRKLDLLYCERHVPIINSLDWPSENMDNELSIRIENTKKSFETAGLKPAVSFRF